MKKSKLILPPITEHKERSHAVLSMSQAERYMACPGSVMLSHGVDRSRSSAAAEEGTFAHEVSEIMFRNRAGKKKWPLPAVPKAYDPHLLAHCETYVDTVCALTGDIHIEVDLQFKGMHPNLGGSSDVVNIDGPVMRVIDLKFGKSPVSAKDNPQLMGYAVGARKTFDVKPKVIELMIHQPRAKHSKHVITDEELDAFEVELQAAAVLTDDPFAPLQMTDKGCFWCRAKPVCPEYAKVAKAAAASEFAAAPPKKGTPSAIEPVKLLDALVLAQKLAPWCDAVLLQAKDALAADPAALPGYALKPGRKMSKWEDETAAMRDLETLIADLGAEAQDYIRSIVFTLPGLQAPNKVLARLEDADLLMPTKHDELVLAKIAKLVDSAFTSNEAASSLVKAKGLE